MWEVEWALEGKLTIQKTPFKGVFLVKTEEDARKRIREYETTAVCRVIPLDLVVPTDEAVIQEKALQLAVEKIGENETFAVRCKNRGEAVDSRKLERDLGEQILSAGENLTVNLTFPQKTVKIEVFGKRTGIAVLKDGDIVEKEAVE
jgi:tRNA acetyltransferase TAN1